ncbi:MAG: hypothetical protein PHW97_01035 [Fermentimonas sp.]|nr:hypothetical protein [Fermentimonas sp.]
MKKYLILILLLFSYLTLSAQTLSGTFKNGNDSISFSDDKVSFRITGFAGLSTVQVGEGSHEFVEDFMLVNTTDYSGPKSTYNAQNAANSDTCTIKVVSMNNYPVQGILVESKNGSDKIIGASVTGADGKIVITDYEKISKMTFSAMGYHSITIDFSPGNDFVVKIAENDIIENSTVAFKFNKIDDETISLILLTDDLDISRNLSKELDKLNKKARKTNLIGKRFTKELSYYTR